MSSLVDQTALLQYHGCVRAIDRHVPPLLTSITHDLFLVDASLADVYQVIIDSAPHLRANAVECEYFASLIDLCVQVSVIAESPQCVADRSYLMSRIQSIQWFVTRTVRCLPADVCFLPLVVSLRAFPPMSRADYKFLDSFILDLFPTNSERDIIARTVQSTL
jgi:hypothetical protein